MVIDSSNIRQNGTTQANAEAGKARRGEAADTKKTPEAKEAKSSDGDSVSLSLTGKSLASLEAILANTPEVDSARVDALKAAVANGTYKVDASAIADKMLAQDKLLGQ